MNRNINQLLKIASKNERHIIGLMSGTSLDGLDIALCAIKGHGTETRVVLKYFTTVAYPGQLKERIKEVFAQQKVDFGKLVLLNGWLAKQHGRWIKQALTEWKVQISEVDLIASHGQTVFHYPKSLHQMEEYDNATLQIGDGDHLAVETGIITMSDFRQKHIAAGGEGAPLALYGDFLLFTKAGEDRILLNMGGIANFTFLPASADIQQVVVTDTGPGNTLIDAFTQKLFDKEYDRDAQFAKNGSVIDPLLHALKEHPFFEAGFPKTTGPELFNIAYVEEAQKRCGCTQVSPYDLLATLTRFSADTIVDALYKIVRTTPSYEVFASGGGAHNPLLLHWIESRIPGLKIRKTDELGVPGDAKEAVLFAILANEALVGEPLRFNRAGYPGVTMGKISFPV